MLVILELESLPSNPFFCFFFSWQCLCGEIGKGQHCCSSGQLSCLITAVILTSYCSSDSWALERGRGKCPSPKVLVYFSSADSTDSSLSSPLTTSTHSVCACNYQWWDQWWWCHLQLFQEKFIFQNKRRKSNSWMSTCCLVSSILSCCFFPWNSFPLSLDSFALGAVIFVVPKEYPWVC